MTAEAIQDVSMAFKKALIERARAGSSATTWDTRQAATSRQARRGGQPPQRQHRQDR